MSALPAVPTGSSFYNSSNGAGQVHAGLQAVLEAGIQEAAMTGSERRGQVVLREGTLLAGPSKQQSQHPPSQLPG